MVAVPISISAVPISAPYLHICISAYGSYAISKDQWPTLAEEIKQGFMDNFGNKYKKFLSDPKNVEAFNFVQDYNFGKIPHNSENDQKYEQYLETVNKALDE
jgi:hypothetical protein